MDWPLRTRILAAFVGVVVVSGALTVAAGSLLISRMVVGQAQRRVDLALTTADAMLEQRLGEAGRVSHLLAAPGSASGVDRSRLEQFRREGGYDYLELLDREGRVTATASGRGVGTRLGTTAVWARALESGAPAAGVCLVPLATLAAEDPGLAERAAHLQVVATPHSHAAGPAALTDVMALEAAAPILDAQGRLLGTARVGTVLNGNFDLVDYVRDNVFTPATYEGKNLGTVTVFQGDVRIATNVVGRNGVRAVGTRVSAEVYDRVLGQGRRWTGPAFVVDTWYLSAYEPLRDPRGVTLGMLYVGVLKARYDDMRRQAVGLLAAIALAALIVAAGLSLWLAGRLTRPLARLTDGAAEVARGNLEYRLDPPRRSERDEINRLTVAFNQMVGALRERDELLRGSRDELQATADQLNQWVQNYLDTLGFITHELKNQIAAMKINLLAVREGYVGAITEEQRQALGDVAEAIERAEEMILSYLNLSRIEKGELQVRARPLQVEADLVRPVLQDQRARLETRQMQVEVEVPPDLVVQADPALLRTVYDNLIGNAAKYGRAGGLIRVSGRRLENAAELHVWNDGPGVPAEQQNELFRKFTRLHLAQSEDRGTGLGLFITREIIRRHGGDIHAEGAAGEWIDFVFTLPVPDALREEPTDEIGG